MEPAPGGGTANISLIDASATVTQIGDTAWTLDKTGSLSGNTVSWNILATPVATTAGLLVFNGQMTVFNYGTGPATIGNIVVNLQKRVANKWVTKSSDIADATLGDAATTANIHKTASSENKSTFTENGASGSLEFMDATNNTIFSLVPQVTIGAGQSRALLFSAEFDNNNAALQLTPGTQIRAEVIVSFGNATANGNSTANVDINGNGTVTLTDTIDDISATGDVTFSNVTFNLGATSGTVTANVSGGTNGGSITNCAHLAGNDQTVNSGGFTFPIVNGVDLQACSTINVAGQPPTCTPGAPGCGWDPGDMSTFTQSSWGDGASTAGTLLVANFTSVFGSSLEIGGTFFIAFTSAAAVINYLPAVGTASVLTASVQNPLSTSSGELGGEVLALQINTDFSSLLGNAVSLGSLRFCNVTDLPSLNGQTVDEFLATANHLLGGGSAPMSPTTAAAIARRVNNAFVNGTPSSFAQASLVAAGTCPAN